MLILYELERAEKRSEGDRVDEVECVVVGAGVVGLAVARALVGLASPDVMQQNDDAAVEAAISAFDHLLPVRRQSPVGPAQLPAH